MSIGNRLVSWVLVVGMAVSPVAQAAEIQAENWSRLRAMPREQRRALWEKLQEFDALGPSEKAAIRALDARIAQLPPADQADYWSVLRRYHRWVRSLGEDQQNELNSVPASQRMRLVTKLRAQERTTANETTTPLFLQVIDFTAVSPIESAHRLKAWFDLSPEKRAEIEEIPSPADRQKRLAELGQHAKLGPVHRLTKAEEEALWAKLEANPQMKNWLAIPLKKADPTKHEKVRRRIATNYYFLEHPPAAVDPVHLTRFEAALPSWYRGRFDHLPPEEARRRLTILYRLVFPAPGEMPEGPKAGHPPGTTSASKPARPGPTTGASPF